MKEKSPATPSVLPTENSTFRYLNYDSIRSRERKGRTWSSYMLSLVEARYLEYRCQYRECLHTFWHVRRSIPSFFPTCPHHHWAFSHSVMTRIRWSRVVSICRLPIGCCSRVLLTFILAFFESCGFLIFGYVLVVKLAFGRWLPSWQHTLSALPPHLCHSAQLTLVPQYKHRVEGLGTPPILHQKYLTL